MVTMAARKLLAMATEMVATKSSSRQAILNEKMVMIRSTNMRRIMLSSGRGIWAKRTTRKLVRMIAIDRSIASG